MYMKSRRAASSPSSLFLCHSVSNCFRNRFFTSGAWIQWSLCTVFRGGCSCNGEIMTKCKTILVKKCLLFPRATKHSSEIIKNVSLVSSLHTPRSTIIDEGGKRGRWLLPQNGHECPYQFCITVLVTKYKLPCSLCYQMSDFFSANRYCRTKIIKSVFLLNDKGPTLPVRHHTQRFIDMT